jgi:transposase
LILSISPIERSKKPKAQGAKPVKRSQHRMPRTLNRDAYPSDLTDEQWELLEPLVPAIAPDAAYHVHTRREIVNAILYVLRSGCSWRMLPHEFPAWGTVYFYFRKWQREGVWDQVLKALRMEVRKKEGRDPEPSAAIIDSQSIPHQCGSWPGKGLRQWEKKSGAGNATCSLIPKAISWPSR